MWLPFELYSHPPEPDAQSPPIMTVSSFPWRSVGFALFGAAALVAAFGYAVTRPVQTIITARDTPEEDGKEMMDVTDFLTSDSDDDIVTDKQ